MASDDSTADELAAVPERYAREIRAREQLHEACPVDVYVAGINPRFSWPHRLVSAREANRPALRETCETLIVDSVMQDEYYPVADVLDAAEDIGADYVVMKDYPGEDGIALDAYEYFMSRYFDHETDVDVIPVLEAGRVREQWRFFENTNADHDVFGVGGMRDFTPERQVEVMRRARDAVGGAVRLHAFGVGTSPEVVRALRDSVEDGRPLVDSLDISTPEHAVGKNKIPDKTWSQQRVALPTGEDSTTVRAGFAEAVARMLVYELTPGCDDEDLLAGAAFGTLG
jgi:hypothetical protein